MHRTRRGFTVFVLGAGASHEGGVPLSAQILPVGYQLFRDLRDRMAGEAPSGDYLTELTPSHLEAFQRVYDFIAHCFQGHSEVDALDLQNLPGLDELWGIVEIAYRNRAEFGCHPPDRQTARVRNALMTLMYHVLVGCRLEYGEGHSYRVHYGHCDNPYEGFVDQLEPGDAVIALNYDTLLDRALRAAGYGIDYGTDVLATHGKPEVNGRRVQVLKLHGSFNWLWCPSCNTIQDFGEEDVAYIPLETSQPEELCPIDQTPRDYIIIPPSLIKSYDNLHIRRIWDTAATALRTCTRLVFAGYAMADSDIYVKYLVKQGASLNGALNGTDRIEVVNVSESSMEPYYRLFGKERVKAITAPFGEFVRRNGRG